MELKKRINTVTVAVYYPKDDINIRKVEVLDTLKTMFPANKLVVHKSSNNVASYAIRGLESPAGEESRIKFMLDYNFKRFVKGDVMPDHIISSSIDLLRAVDQSKNASVYRCYDFPEDAYVYEHLPHLKYIWDIDQYSRAGVSPKQAFESLLTDFVENTSLKSIRN